MPIRKRYPLLFCLGLVASPAVAAATFAPGRWSHETRLVQADVPGIPEWVIRMFAGHGSRKSCNGAAQLNSHPEALLTADDDAVCKLRKFSATNGKLVFDTFCTNKRFPDGLLVSSHGSYTSTSYSISTTSTGTRNGKPVRILTTGTGKHVADACTGPERSMIGTWLATAFATAISFLALDSIWLTLAASLLYRPRLGSLLLERFNLVPAVAFYLIYLTGILIFAVAPALATGRWTAALIRGAMLGLVAYATYDLTNQATLRGWSVTVTIADLCWGMFVTATAATIGFTVARWMLARG